MATKGYLVYGSSEMLEVGAEALEAMRAYLRERENIGAEVAEIRIYENMPIEAVVCHDDGHDWLVWDRKAWIPKF